MPHVQKEIARRIRKEAYIPTLHNAGQLNHHLTKVCQRYLIEKGESYQTYNDILGALEGCKLEAYRLKVSVYEDKKRAINGDAWGDDE